MNTKKTEEQRLQEAKVRHEKKERLRAQRHLSFVLENPDCDEDLQSAQERAEKAGVAPELMGGRR